MFRHIFYYRLISGLRDRELLFWTLFFPIILATLFNFAFSNLYANESFNQVPIAVVTNEYWENDIMLQQVMSSLSEGDDALFALKKTSQNQADLLLDSDEIIGYLIPAQNLEVVIRYSGLRQSMLTAFADEYVQTGAAISRLVEENPGIDVMSLLTVTGSYISDDAASDNRPDSTVVYYYALIAMACLYGGYWGLREVIAVKANLSGQAARINISPVPKMQQFIYAMLASFLIHFASIMVLLLYLSLILDISFGNQIWHILLACFIGSSLGVNIGALIGVIGNRSENVKSAILTGFSMLMSFFAGLMVADMKYIVSQNMPILRWINPANLVSDALYAIYYYDTTARYWQNILAMLVFQLIAGTIVITVMRRQRYASI